MYEDFLDLHAPESRDNEPVKRAFYELERAVWRSEGWLEPPDTSRLVQALLSSVPAKHREGVSKAFGKVEGATVATALVREQAAYMIGLAMGRRVVD
jgi:hypothetical protein